MYLTPTTSRNLNNYHSGLCWGHVIASGLMVTLVQPWTLCNHRSCHPPNQEHPDEQAFRSESTYNLPDTDLSSLQVLLNSHKNFTLYRLLLSVFYQWGNKVTGRASHLSRSHSWHVRQTGLKAWHSGPGSWFLGYLPPMASLLTLGKAPSKSSWWPSWSVPHYLNDSPSTTSLWLAWPHWPLHCAPDTLSVFPD